jgi:hypothetical protein
MDQLYARFAYHQGGGGKKLNTGPPTAVFSLLCLVCDAVHPCVVSCLQTANGAIACQLLDALYPNTVPMKKVQ